MTKRDPPTARTGPTWSHAEYVRVLQAWRFVLQTRGDASAGASIVPDDVAQRTFKRFAELTERSDGHTTNRSVDSIARKMEKLMRVYRVMIAYNEQQVKRQRAQRQRRTPDHNFWLALSLSKQQRAFAAYHAPSSFVAVDEEMFALLGAIDRARSYAQAHDMPQSNPMKASNVWTKGEVWVLVTAWRQVVEMGGGSPGDRGNAHEHMLPRIYARFCALARPGMPQRTKGSVKAKVANLATLYKVVKDFNARTQRRSASTRRRRLRTGPHDHGGDDGDDDDDDDDAGDRDWFSASSVAKAQHLIESNTSRAHRLAEFDRDTFDALELIMARVRGDATRSDAHHVIIELSSDTEGDDDGDDRGGGAESDWEFLPTLSSARGVRSSPPRAVAPPSSSRDRERGFVWRSVVDASAWSTERDAAPAECEGALPAAAPPMARHSVQRLSTAAWTARAECARRPAAAAAPPPTTTTTTPLSLPLTEPETQTGDSDCSSQERARKRARSTDSPKHEASASKSGAAAMTTTTTSETEQRFLAILAKLKRERRVDKVKRRAERHEREALTALIAEERKLRRRDKKERLLERQAWELERDKLKLKLKSMREKYKRARRALTTS